MHSTKNHIHAEVGYEYAEEGEYAIKMEGFWIAQEPKGFLMHGNRVDEEGDQCPGLLGIPGPVVAPGNIGPYGTQESAESQ